MLDLFYVGLNWPRNILIFIMYYKIGIEKNWAQGPWMIFFSEFHPTHIMMNQINGSFTNKTNQPTKQKPKHKYREQLVVTRGDG